MDRNRPEPNCDTPRRVNRHGSNLILTLLALDERERILGRCERITMPIGRLLYEEGGAIDHVYFPLSAMISMVIASEEGGTIEVGVIGNEGLSGGSVGFGSNVSHWKTLIQAPGELLRMSAEDFRRAWKSAGALRDVAELFAHTLTIQISQSVMCNRLHSVEERICRWLLMAHDRVGRDEIELTQEFIAQMLGIRRPSVTVAAGMLQKAGLIDYARGRVQVLDRAGLENAACECYSAVNRELERLMARPGGDSR